MARAPVPNLDLMAKIAGSWERTMKKVAAKNSDLRRYMGKGGARIPAVITRVFPLGDGPNVFSRGFEVYTLNVHGAEPEGSPALVDSVTGNEEILIDVHYNPKPDAKPVPASLPARDTKCTLKSRTIRHFQTNEMDALAKLKPGQIVVLNGVSARAYIPNFPNPSSWGIAYDVQFAEPVHGMTLTCLYLAARGTGTNFMLPNDFHFDQAVPSSRYNREHTHFISVFAPPTTDDERHERLVRMGNECGETRIIDRNWSNKTWEIEAAQGRTRAIKASLDLVHKQWLPDIDPEKYSDVVLLGVSLWSEQLSDFGIPDPDAWVNLAPMIFNKLDFKVFGYVDTKGTEVNFGGVASDKDVSFALQIGGVGIIAGIEACYRRIGIPITADCVLDLQQMPGGAPGGGVAINDDDFVDTLPDVVPVTGLGASAAISRKLIDMARRDENEGKLEFVALIPYNPSPAVLKGLATLTPDEGSALVMALASNSDAEIVSNEKVHGLYEMMATGKSGYVVAFAFCGGIVPDSVKSERNKTLISYMTGKAPSGTAAIEDGSASAAAPAAAPPTSAENATIEEIDDDVGGEEVEGSESESGGASRKRSVKKMSGKGKSAKRKEKRSRHE